MKGWKTILFNVATAAVGIAEVLPPRAALYTAIVGNLILRALTTTPIFRRE